MKIINMNYDSSSGGTLTLGVNDNDKIKHNNIEVPNVLTELISILETRIGEPVNTILFQIDESQHRSEERLIINYTINPETHQSSKTTLNVSNMSYYEKNKYNTLKSELSI